jgi:hypothetical protein
MMTMAMMGTTVATEISEHPLPSACSASKKHTMAGVSDDFRRVAYFYDCMAMLFYCCWINMTLRFLTTSLLCLVNFEL